MCGGKGLCGTLWLLLVESDSRSLLPDLVIPSLGAQCARALVSDGGEMIQERVQTLAAHMHARALPTPVPVHVQMPRMCLQRSIKEKNMHKHMHRRNCRQSMWAYKNHGPGVFGSGREAGLRLVFHFGTGIFLFLTHLRWW